MSSGAHSPDGNGNMISSRAPGGREPGNIGKFEISKRVTIIRGDLEIEGVLQDISVWRRGH